jgi:hypothetical protein
VTDPESDDAAPPDRRDRPPGEMRLRSARPPVTRLSRKVLISLGAIAALGIGGALFLALQPQRKTVGSELYSTDNRNTPDGLANLRRIIPTCPTARRSSDRRCPAISAGQFSMPAHLRRL